MNITPALLSQVTLCMNVNAAKYAAPLQAACDKFGINTPFRLSAFLAQIGHESGSLSAISESFNYSIPALMGTFPRTMPYAMAVKYGRQPNETAVPLARQMQIANIVYGNQYGNGGAASGDGWKFRGSGLVQTTFHDNFKQAGEILGVDLVANPDLVRTDATTAAMCAGAFWQFHALNALADSGNFEAITRRINPKMPGEADRLAIYNRARKTLGIAA